MKRDGGRIARWRGVWAAGLGKVAGGKAGA